MNNSNQTEMELLICCARARMTPDIERRWQALLTLPIHWENLFRLAQYHKMIPLLFHHLSRQTGHFIPSDWLARLREAAHGHVVWNYHQLENQQYLVERLEAHGIPVIPYKGVALSLRLYGGLELRHTGDLDLIVPPADYWRAKALLEADGLVCAEPMTPEAEAEMVRDYNELKMCSEARNLVLELHWGVSPRYFSFPFASMNLWEQTRWQEFNGVRFRQPSDEDTLILLCVHGAQHAWSTLKWISDIAELLRQPLHWEQTLERARTLRSVRMLFVGLWLAHELLGAPLPDRIQQQIARNRVVERLVASVSARIRRGAKQPAAVAIIPFHLFVREQWWERWNYAGMLLNSIRRNWYRAQGSADDSWFAQLLRPARLVKIYANIGVREWRACKSSTSIVRPNVA